MKGPTLQRRIHKVELFDQVIGWVQNLEILQLGESRYAVLMDTIQTVIVSAHSFRVKLSLSALTVEGFFRRNYLGIWY